MDNTKKNKKKRTKIGKKTKKTQKRDLKQNKQNSDLEQESDKIIPINSQNIKEVSEMCQGLDLQNVKKKLNLVKYVIGHIHPVLKI